MGLYRGLHKGPSLTSMGPGLDIHRGPGLTSFGAQTHRNFSFFHSFFLFFSISLSFFLSSSFFLICPIHFFPYQGALRAPLGPGPPNSVGGVPPLLAPDPMKTNVMVFGKGVDFANLFLNDSPIVAVQECKYLGIHITAGKEFQCSVKQVW